MQNTLGKEYKLNYYEIDTDDNLTNLKVSSEIKLEKIIRLITLKDEKFDNGNLKFGVITVNLDNIKNNKIKELLEKVRDTLKKKNSSNHPIKIIKNTKIGWKLKTKKYLIIRT